MKTLLQSLLFLFLFSGLVSSVTAQPIGQAAGESSPYVKQVEVGVPGTSNDFLRGIGILFVFSQLQPSDMAAIGNHLLSETDGNLAITDQRGDGNTALLEQYGRSNIAVMYQIGTRNTTNLLQEGSNNLYSSRLKGDNNLLDVTQRGDDNVYLFDFEGQNLDHTVVQEGNNISARQVGTALRPVSIEQRGNGMDVTVTHNGGR